MKKVTLVILAVALFTTLTSQASNGEQPLELNNTQAVSQFVELTTPVQEKTTSLYLWEINTIYGVAKGYSPSLEHAEKMVGLVSTNDLSNYTVIKSGKLK